MKRIVFSLSMVLALLCSCQIQEFETPYEEDFSGKTEASEVVITASLADAVPETKTEVERTGSSYQVYWLPGDKIRIFSAGETSVFTSQNTERSISAPFKGTVSFVSGSDEHGQTIYTWGIYPARSDQVYDSTAGTIQTILPSVQPGKAGSFADDLAISIGRSSSLSFSFKSAYSGLRVKFGGNDIVSMRICSNGGEALAGCVTFGLDSDNNPEVRSVSAGSSEVTVYAPDGEPFESGKDYYIVTLPKVQLSSGITLTLRRKDGTEGSFSLNSSITLKRNIFSVINANLDELITNWAAAETQGMNEIWYTTSNGNPVDYTVMWTDNTVVSNTYSGGKGVVRFASALTEVDKKAFFGETTLTSVILPETVETIGESAFENCESLASVTMGDRVTLINRFAFSGCSFETIHLSESLKYIGSQAFSGNTHLRTITIPETVTSMDYPYVFYENPFADCSSLESFYGKFASDDHLCLILTYPAVYPDAVFITSFAIGGMNGGTFHIPDGVTTITPLAFFGAHITGVDLNEVTSIMDRAFAYTDLVSLTLPASVGYIGPDAFKASSDLSYIKIVGNGSSLPIGSTGMFDDTGGCDIYVPSLWLEVYKGTAPWSNYASRYCTEIPNNQVIYTAAARIDNDFTGSADSHVFYDSEGKGVLTFAGDVEAIPASAFESTGITSVTIPGSVRTIGYRAFAFCESLTDIILPEGVEYIEYFAFYGCSSLTGMHLPSTIRGVGVYTNHVTPYFNPFVDCSSLVRFTSNSDFVKASADGKFLLSEGGTRLVSVAIGGFQDQMCFIPQSVVTIGNRAFCGSNIAGVYIPDGVTTIEMYAFAGCEDMYREVMIPPSVTTIGEGAFQHCGSLALMTFESDVLPAIASFSQSQGSNTFGDTRPNTDNETTFTIRIPGYACVTSNAKLFDDTGWAFYRLSGRIQLYQPVDEIWVHSSGDANNPYFIPTGMGDATKIGQFAVVPESGFSLDPRVPVPSSLSGASIVIAKYNATVTAVPASAFAQAEGAVNVLDYVSLPPTVTSLGDNAFKGCNWLLTFPVSKYADASLLTSLGEYAFSGCSSMVAASINTYNVTSLGEHAFEGCTGIESITLGAVQTIPNDAFNGCSNLVSVTLTTPSSLERIEDNAFYLCFALVRLGGSDVSYGVMLDNVSSVGLMAFSNTGIVRISMPSATSLGLSAFAACTSLQSVNLPNVIALPHSCFYNDSALSYVNSLQVQTVGVEAFYNCTSLQDIDLRNATSLGAGAFKNCTNLASINIAEVTTIGERCFAGQHKLQTISLANIQSFGTGALGAGTQLEKVVIGKQHSSGIAMTNKLFTYDEENVAAPQINILMGPTTPPSISDNTFTTSSVSGSHIIPYRVVLKTENVRVVYRNAWSAKAPFSSAPSQNVLDQWFVSATSN